MTQTRVARMHYVVIDAGDPERLAEFWGALLGVSVEARVGQNQYVLMHPQADGVPNLAFQRVDDVKQGKNRVHLDLDVADLETSRERIQKLGGSVHSEVQELDGYTWQTMADPEGNEFDIAPE
jgi:predicted enzyme related to lactoylglutathione lyase